jgi:Fur family peroxide stress response transcriptional regulator
MITDFFEILRRKGLKITPQRVAVYKAIVELNNHPTADNILSYLKKDYPNISVGTLYKVLDVFVECGLIRKVKNDREVMRYDAVLHHHHHLYNEDTDEIVDYEDPELDKIINDYFEKKKIKGFKIKDINLQITGKFTPKG